MIHPEPCQELKRRPQPLLLTTLQLPGFDCDSLAFRALSKPSSAVSSAFATCSSIRAVKSNICLGRVTLGDRSDMTTNGRAELILFALPSPPQTVTNGNVKGHDYVFSVQGFTKEPPASKHACKLLPASRLYPDPSLHSTMQPLFSNRRLQRTGIQYTNTFLAT